MSSPRPQSLLEADNVSLSCAGSFFMLYWGKQPLICQDRAEKERNEVAWMDTWENLRSECLACRGCSLCETRHNVVFGDGAQDAEILLIGEGPGQHEDEQGIPFVGRAGKLLDDMLEMVNLDRTKVYIANIVKCRPPNNRDPLGVEQDACMDWLRRQTVLLRPKIIVCLGRVAAKAIIKDDFRITQEHGQWFTRGGVQMTAI